MFPVQGRGVWRPISCLLACGLGRSLKSVLFLLPGLCHLRSVAILGLATCSLASLSSLSQATAPLPALQRWVQQRQPHTHSLLQSGPERQPWPPDQVTPLHLPSSSLSPSTRHGDRSRLLGLTKGVVTIDTRQVTQCC